MRFSRDRSNMPALLQQKKSQKHMCTPTNVLRVLCCSHLRICTTHTAILPFLTVSPTHNRVQTASNTRLTYAAVCSLFRPDSQPPDRCQQSSGLVSIVTTEGGRDGERESQKERERERQPEGERESERSFLALRRPRRKKTAPLLPDQYHV